MVRMCPQASRVLALATVGSGVALADSSGQTAESRAQRKKPVTRTFS
jgi:hypothetical protein